YVLRGRCERLTSAPDDCRWPHSNRRGPFQASGAVAQRLEQGLINLAFCPPELFVTNAITENISELARPIQNVRLSTERSKASRLRALLVTKQRKKRRVRSRSQPWGYPKRT